MVLITELIKIHHGSPHGISHPSLHPFTQLLVEAGQELPPDLREVAHQPVVREEETPRFEGMAR